MSTPKFVAGNFYMAKDAKNRVLEVLEILSRDHVGTSFIAREWTLGYMGRTYCPHDHNLLAMIEYKAEEHIVCLYDAAEPDSGWALCEGRSRPGPPASARRAS